MQKVNINAETAPCIKCKNDLAVLGSFTYSGVTDNFPRARDEHCTCNKCGQTFLLHYELFDKDNHVINYVFNEDVNDPTYKWQDQLAPEQKKEIEEHLRICAICRDRLTDEMLSDAWLSSILHNIPPTK